MIFGFPTLGSMGNLEGGYRNQKKVFWTGLLTLLLFLKISVDVFMPLDLFKKVPFPDYYTSLRGFPYFRVWGSRKLQLFRSKMSVTRNALDFKMCHFTKNQLNFWWFFVKWPILMSHALRVADISDQNIVIFGFPIPKSMGNHPFWYKNRKKGFFEQV